MANPTTDQIIESLTKYVHDSNSISDTTQFKGYVTASNYNDKTRYHQKVVVTIAVDGAFYPKDITKQYFFQVDSAKILEIIDIKGNSLTTFEDENRSATYEIGGMMGPDKTFPFHVPIGYFLTKELALEYFKSYDQKYMIKQTIGDLVYAITYDYKRQYIGAYKIKDGKKLLCGEFKFYFFDKLSQKFTFQDGEYINDSLEHRFKASCLAENFD